MKKISYHMVVVGTGGTGTTFLRDIGRYINNKPDCPIKKVTLVDGDVIEKKNIERQIFFPSQVGQHKATAMEHMLHCNYPDVSLEAVAKYLATLDELKAILHDVVVKDGRMPLLIGCVDNNAARLLLESYFLDGKVKDCVYFDSGNDYAAGEVIMSYKHGGRVLSPVRSEYFPEIKTGDLRPVTEMSCTELNAVDPQHPLVNIMAGQILTSAVINLCEGRAKYSSVDFDAQEFIEDAHPIVLSANNEEPAPEKEKPVSETEAAA